MSYQRTAIRKKTKKTSNKLILPQKNINEYRKMPQCTTARLFYDNKNISLDLSGEIAAIELQWEGYARFQNKCGKGWIPMIDKNHMLLFSMGKESVNLNILDYHGKIRINFCRINLREINIRGINLSGINFSQN